MVLATDIVFRPMLHTDIDVGLQLCRLAGWDQTRRDWERFVAADHGTAHVALHEGRVVGTVATIRFGREFGWIGMVLVHRDVQGRGVGAVLLGHATAELADLGSIRLDATPAGRGLYLKHGFIDEYSLRRVEAAPATVAAPGHSWITPLTREGLADVIALDRQVFGAPRAELLEWMYDGSPGFGFVARRNGEIAGYILGRQGHEFEHLGPIIASDANLAVELTTTCLAGIPGRPVVIDSTSEAEAWVRFLERTGFREQRPYIRMSRGGQAPFGLEGQQFAILGPEFG